MNVLDVNVGSSKSLRPNPVQVEMTKAPEDNNVTADPDNDDDDDKLGEANANDLSWSNFSSIELAPHPGIKTMVKAANTTKESETVDESKQSKLDILIGFLGYFIHNEI